MKKAISIPLWLVISLACSLLAPTPTDLPAAAAPSTHPQDALLRNGQFDLSNLALDKPVRASNSLPNFPPESAVDGVTSLDMDSWWGSGEDAPQWIEIDLQGSASIEGIRLLTSQGLAGETLHRIFGCDLANRLQLLHKFSGFTRDGEWLEFTPPEPWRNIRCIRVETPQSPSEVGWREIEVIGAIEDEEEVVLTPIVPPQVPTLIFHNGQVIDMAASVRVHQAIAIHGDTIIALGTDVDILALARPSTTRIDLAGRTLMPSIVDAHTHIFNDGMSRSDMLGHQELLLENGITTIGILFTTPSLLAEMRDMESAGQLRLRTSLYLVYNTNCDTLVGNWYITEGIVPNRGFGDFLRVTGIKFFTDGGTCDKLPAVSEEFLPGQGLGDLFLTQAELDAPVLEAQNAGFQVAIHAIGDRGVDLALNAIEAALAGSPNTFRHRIEHNGIIRPDQIPRYGAIDIVPTLAGYFPACAAGHPRSPFYQQSEAPWRRLLDSNPGLHYAWHGDDFEWGPVSPMLELFGMVTRNEVAPDGSICSPPAFLTSQGMTQEEGLRAMTTGAAYALFREGEVGSLEPGKLADLTILSDNPLRAETDDIIDIEVWMTMVDGKTEYCAAGHETMCP